MDDALVLPKTAKEPVVKLVLILVVMDDALVQQKDESYCKCFFGLNPCCNG